MENFDMRILRLILEELVKTGRLHDGDKITPGTEVNKSALSLIYSHGVTIDGGVSESGISIKGCTDGLVITLTSNEQETTTLLVDHQPFDEAKTSYAFVAAQLVSAVGLFDHYCRHAKNTARMERLINDHLLILNEIEPFDKKERETLSPEVTIVVSPSGMLNIEVHENVYYAVSLAELQEYAADRVHTA